MRKEPRLLRVGVLGCGPISQFAHLEACRKARNAELYAICDVAEDLVEKMAAIHAPQVTYTDYRAMLSDPNVEAVIVGVADQFHVPAAREAIEAGKHVLVEKPMGVDVEECVWLRDSCSRSAPRSASIPASPSRSALSGSRWGRCSPSRPGIATLSTVTL
jgi:predicted dehydrogenase